MKIKTRTLPIIILGVFWGIIAVTMVTGAWETQSTMAEIEVYSPSDIKGWMTLQDISDNFNIPMDKLKEVFELPVDIKDDMPIKEIAEENEKETEDYRNVLSMYLGLSTEATSEASVDNHEITEVQDQNKQKENEQIDNKEEPQVQPQSKPIESTENSSDAVEHEPKGDGTGEEVGAGQVIKGRMTFNEVEYVTKVPTTYICEQLGIPQDVSRDVPLRDLAQEYGFEVDAIRDIVDNYN